MNAEHSPLTLTERISATFQLEHRVESALDVHLLT